MHEATPLYVYMPIIYFIYGISFFMLGVTIAAERVTSSATDNLKLFVLSPLGYLSGFGLTHGMAELMDMSSIIYYDLIPPLKIIRLLLMPVSFYFLFCFGVLYMRQNGPGPTVPSWRRFCRSVVLPRALFGIWCVIVAWFFVRNGFSDEWLDKGDIFSRYILGVPGSLAAAASLFSRKGKASGKRQRRALLVASLGFVFYAVVGGLIVPAATFFPASVLNYESFDSLSPLPAQLFRTLCAVVITIALLRFFRVSREIATIRFKSVLNIFITMVFPASIVIALGCYMIAGALLKLSYSEKEKIALLTAAHVRTFFHTVEEKLRYRALLSGTVEPSLRERVFMSLVGGNSQLDSISLIDEGGVVLRVDEEHLSGYGKKEDTRKPMRLKSILEALSTETSGSNFLITGHAGGNIFIEQSFGLKKIAASIRTVKLYETLSLPILERGWHALLLDEKGGAVIPEEKHYLNKNDISGHRRGDGKGFGSAFSEGGIYYYALEKEVMPGGWSVIIEVPRDDIVAPIFRIYKGLLLGVFLVYLISIIFAVILADRLTKPIHLIAEKVKLIGRGDFDQKLDLKTGDELQVLSEEIEKMAVSLAERKKTEERLARAEKIASLGRLVAGVAHEINNPLGIILGYCQVLLREPDIANRHMDDLKTIESHSLQCKKIVEDLLKFSRPYKQVEVGVDLNANIGEALSLIPTYVTKSIDITFDPGHASPVIKGDPDRLHQLFLNLIMNAIDAMDTGGKLIIGTAEAPKLAGSIEITIRDTGSGIKEGDMPKIFEPFFTTKEVGKGTGLGLAVSYGIVKDHGGEIWAESAENTGTIFHIIFPKVRAHEQ
ncbi:MAG: sensor histidine kinase [Thermodesulfovibrionales bacterium]